MIDAEKMSKSLGNIFSIGDLVDKGYSPREIRLTLLSAHYRQQMNFTYEGLESARAAIERIDCCLQNLRYAQGGGGEKETAAILSEHEAAFREAMDDDLNFPNALAAVFGLIRDLNILCSQGKVGQTEAAEVFDTLRRVDSVLGFVMPEQIEESDSEIDALVCAREDARKSKNWAEADRIRNLLIDRNIILEDRAGGTAWRRK
jgi:cysteinyl-tRNA synthetase